MAEQRYNESGFTMIELIMVIVIVGILAASARALLNTEAFEQRYFADDALQAMRFAQQIAVTQGCAVQLELNNNDGFYLKQDADCGVDDTPDFSHTNYLNRPTSTDDYTNTDWPDGVTLTENDATLPAADSNTGQSTVVFYPQGWACVADGSSAEEYTYDFTSTFTISLNLVCATGFSYEG